MNSQMHGARRLAADLDDGKQPDEGFTWDKELIFDQARNVQRLSLEDPPFGEHFLVFDRLVRVVAPDGYVADRNGMCWGNHIAVYRCNEKGKVDSWKSRFELEAHCYDVALAKFRWMLANDVIFVEKALQDNNEI